MPYQPAIARPGVVYLVGAGPGDPGLITVKARDLLGTCHSVLYDRLIARGVLDLAHPSAERLDVGKAGHGTQVSQQEIERLLVERAREGRAVVRLKGGCPTLFGRLAEEAEALRAAAVPFEIVPGVSSALAVPAYAGIPVTHRSLASSLAIVTGHCASRGKRPLAAVAHADTVVVLMAARALPEIVGELLAAGRSPATPAAFISRGTHADQRSLRATLGTLCAEVSRSEVRAPAVVVGGEVVELADRLRWFPGLPDKSGTALIESDTPVTS